MTALGEHRVRAIGFDLDDTLFDHAGAVDTAARAFIADLGGVVTENQVESWRELEDVHFERWRLGIVGFEQQRRDRLSAFLPLVGIGVNGIGIGGCDAVRLDELFGVYLAHYRAAWRAVDGAHEILQDLRRRGIAIGILTNGQRAQQEQKLEATGLLPLVDVVLTPEQTGYPKPDSRAFHALAAELGFAPREVGFVGDNPDHDIAGARAAGLPAAVVAVGRSGTGAELSLERAGSRTPTLAEAVASLLT